MQQSFNHDFGQLGTQEQEALTETVKALIMPELITGIEIHRDVGNIGKPVHSEGLDIDITYRTEDVRVDLRESEHQCLRDCAVESMEAEPEVKPMEFLEPFALRVTVPQSQEEPEVISQTRNMGKGTHVPEDWKSIDDTKTYSNLDTRHVSGEYLETEEKRGRTFEEARRLKTTAKQRQQLRIRTKLQKQARKNNR